MPRRSERIARKGQTDVQSQLPPLTEFALFPKLPTEIRSIIWNLTLHPRVVDIRRISSEYGEYFFGATAAPYPKALLVSSDSRTAVLPHYPLCFGTFWSGAYLRFNFALDTLYIDHGLKQDIPTFFNATRNNEIARVRFLAIDMALFRRQEEVDGSDDGEYQKRFLDRLQDLIKRMDCLEELIEVYDLRPWAPHCYTENHALYRPDSDGQWYANRVTDFFESLPEELKDPALDIDPVLPKSSEFFSEWDIPNIRIVFGKMRCTIFRADKPRHERRPQDMFGWVDEEDPGE